MQVNWMAMSGAAACWTMATLNNNGCERTFIEVWKMDAASETRLCDEMAVAYETPKAKKQRIDKKMVAVPAKSEVSEKSQASDAFEESAQEGSA